MIMLEPESFHPTVAPAILALVGIVSASDWRVAVYWTLTGWARAFVKPRVALSRGHLALGQLLGRPLHAVFRPPPRSAGWMLPMVGEERLHSAES